MNLKTLDQIYALDAFSDYQASVIEHCLIYIKDLEQYALITHGGILFDDYKFIEDVDISNKGIENLADVVKFIEDSFGSIVVIAKQDSVIDAIKKPKKHLSTKEILETNPHFRAYQKIQDKKLFWSEIFDKYYLTTEKGIMFEDGVFYSREECFKLQTNIPAPELLKAVHLAKYEFGCDQVKLLD